ncbi:MAG: class I SAM-dependent methyltransferase [Pseudomonadota bacterium]
MTEHADRSKITTANLAAWDEAAPIHAKHNHAALLEDFGTPGFSVLDELETGILTSLGVAGKDVAQICCNNGRELVSVKTLGAARCVGFDGAPGFIVQARELAESASLEVEFVCTDIYEIGPEYAASFDLVTITIGVLSWMPDLDGFFRVVANLIRPGGALFIYEQHPMTEMLNAGSEDDPVEFEVSYFSKEPYIETDGLDYYGFTSYDAKPATSFLHPLGEVIMAGVNSAMTLEHIREYPDHISNTWYNVEAANLGVPMSYTLVLRKN